MFQKQFFYKMRCKNFYNLIIYKEEDHFKNAILNHSSDEMHVYLNVFLSLMLYYIFGEIDRTLIVTLYCGRVMCLEYKILKDPLNQEGLLTWINCFSILCFYQREIKALFLIIIPNDRSRTMK
jgi:hypothetical protein